MNKKILGTFVLLGLLLANAAFAQDFSAVLKRTNPGIVGVKSAELIFSVANMNTEHKMQGFMLCRTPDDAYVTSAWGAGEGDAAQYMSPIRTIEKAPAIDTISLMLESDTAGDKRADCTLKYIPFREIGATTKTESFEGTYSITPDGVNVEGYIVKLGEYTAAVAATNETVAVPAKVKVGVDAEVKEVEVESAVTIGALKITVSSASATSADATISGTKTVTVGGKKEYLLMSGEYITELKDANYRQIRLDKTVPFVTDMANPRCPEGKDSCKSAEVIEAAEVGGKGLAKWLQNYPIWIVIGLLVLGVVYVLGRR